MTVEAAQLTAALIDRVLEVPGSRAASTAASWLLEALGADRVEVYLLDRRRERLHLAAADQADDTTPASEPHLGVQDSPAGQALRTDSVLRHRADGHAITHVPLGAYGNTVGVLSVVEDVAARARATDAEHDLGPTDWRRLGRTLAVLLYRAAATTDELELVRRTYDYSTAAELQWQLLPPSDLATLRFELCALIEPAPRVTTDLYDWSLNGDRLTVVLLDAVGRGLRATQNADLALAALRNSRRRGGTIADQAALAEQTLWDRYHGHAAVHALLIEIDLDAGTAQAVHAGSPYALRRRGPSVDKLALDAHEPLGLLDRTTYRARPVDLQPGDALLVLSDGVTTAPDELGRAYGVEGIARRLGRAVTPRDLPTWLIDDLRRHAGGELADDATAIAFIWNATSS